jgi:putative membrane protein
MWQFEGRWRLAAAGLFLGLFTYDAVLRPILAAFIPVPTIPGGLRSLTVVLLLFSVFHASYLVGSRLAVTFFAATAAISWAFEEVGVATGLIYGPYHYTDALGPWLGSVPILIPLAWFMMVYPSYVIANLIVDGRPSAVQRGPGHLLGVAALAALVMTAWDLLIDPILAGPDYQAWIWEAGGPYFGVPAQNYVGWFVTSLAVQLVFRLAARRWPPDPAGPIGLVVAAMPVAAYGAMLVGNLLSGLAPAGAGVAGAIAMGIPILAAGLGLLRSRGDAPPRPG